MSERVPQAAALFSALRFRDRRPESLRALGEAEWRRLLAFSDRAHLTLILGHVCPDQLPGWVRERIGRNLEDNTERLVRIQAAYLEIAEALLRAGAEHLVLKGFSRWPHFVAEPRLRQQSDIDLYCPPTSLLPARDALFAIGYEPGRAPDHDRADHLPALVRLKGWQWRGNAFDPEMPPAIELHHRFWSRSRVRLGPVNLEPFWSRRSERLIAGVCFPALHPVDSFGYSALHALRDLLYGGLMPSHIYELSFFLHQNAGNDSLWRTWLDWHDEELRSLAAVPALLAARWFAPLLPDAVAAEIDRLPGVVQRWFQKFSNSPLEGMFRENKDALWLHLGLLESARDRFSILLPRLFPLWMPGLNSRWVQEENGAGDNRHRPVRRCATYLNWFVIRTIRHLRMSLLALWQGLRLWAS